MNTSSGGAYSALVSRGLGSYSLEISLQCQDDAGSGGDAGDKPLEALQIEPGQTFSGEIGDYDQEDWYQFEVADGETIVLETFAADPAALGSAGDLNPALGLYDPAGNLVASHEAVLRTNETPGWRIRPPPAAPGESG